MAQTQDWEAIAAQLGGQMTTPPADDWESVAAELGGTVADEPKERSLARQFADEFKANMGIGADMAIGAAKGAGSTVFGLGKLVRDYTPIGRISDAIQPGAFNQKPEELTPTNTAQQVGYVGEQMGEFLVPAGAAGKLTKAAEIGKAGALTAAQGGTGTESAVAAGVSAVLPGAAAISRAGKAIQDQAVPLVRAALKPTLSAMRRVTGAGGIDAKTKSLVQFIIDNRLTSPEKAQQLVTRAEGELQSLLAQSTTATDAPQRAIRYLQALERSAAKQGLPASDVATIRNAAAEVLESGLGKDVVRMVPTPHPTLLGPNGKPVIVLMPQTSRALRTDVGAGEALERARASGRWGNRKQWGEQKGAQVEASKAVERAERDAMKAAVPDARPILRTEGQAIQSREVLERAAHRTGNRDAASLPAHVIAAGEIASGRFPVMAFAANWLRNNQMKAGIYADRLGQAIQRNDVGQVLSLLTRLGVPVSGQAVRAVQGQ
jgi:hypothetical protein